MLGLRGVPNVQGGVEKHVEELARLYVTKDWDVEVIGRRPYLEKKQPYVWEGVRVTPIWAPTSMKFEAIVHTVLGVLRAGFKRRMFCTFTQSVRLWLFRWRVCWGCARS